MFEITGNELKGTEALTEGEHEITVRVTDANDLTFDKVFTITALAEAGENPVDPPDEEIEIPDPEDPETDEDGFEEPPIQQNTTDGLKITGKNSGSAVFLRPLTMPGVGGSITYRHTFDGSAMSRGGSEAAFGLMLKENNAVHITTLRGDGNTVSTAMLASRITGDFRKANQFVKTSDGTAADTTKAGPNYVRLVRPDADTYSLYAGDDVEDLHLIQETRATTPLDSMSDALEFGFAGVFTQQDKGVFQYTISVLENVDVPAQFGTGDWSVADDGTGGDITITITALPDDGGSAITDLEYQIDGGSWVSLAGTTTGDYPVSGLTDDVEVDVAVRAVNAVGNGTASATKAVTPTTALPEPYWESVVLLVQPNAADGTTTFPDLSSFARTLTTHGDAQVLNNKVELDGTGDSISAANSADLLFGSGPFTIEVFAVEFDGLSDMSVISLYDSSQTDRSWLIHFNGGSLFGAIVSTTGSTSINCHESFTPTTVTPYDVCLERSGDDLRWYRGGTMRQKVTVSGSLFAGTERLYIGARGQGTGAVNLLNGRMTAVRITKGVARYATDTSYTVPSLPLPS